MELKPIHHEAVAAALEKAERYRLLNEPFLAESICLDILTIEADNQKALVIHILSLADQFIHGMEEAEKRARTEVLQLKSEFERAYYNGIICERRAHALLSRGAHGAKASAFHCIEEAMEHYAKAEKLSPPGHDEAILRWNTCVRMIQRHRLERPDSDRTEYPLE